MIPFSERSTGNLAVLTQAGSPCYLLKKYWIPAFAGMTYFSNYFSAAVASIVTVESFNPSAEAVTVIVPDGAVALITAIHWP